MVGLFLWDFACFQDFQGFASKMQSVLKQTAHKWRTMGEHHRDSSPMFTTIFGGEIMLNLRVRMCQLMKHPILVGQNPSKPPMFIELWRPVCQLQLRPYSPGFSPHIGALQPAIGSLGVGSKRRPWIGRNGAGDFEPVSTNPILLIRHNIICLTCL